MSQSTKIRQLVAINSGPIRAANLILSDKKITLAKVAFLIGGPDWPTSVLCGILRLDLLQCLLGTIPVILVSTPCVISGAFVADPSKPADAGEKPCTASTFSDAQESQSNTGEMWGTMA